MKKIIFLLFTIAAAFGFGGCAQSDIDDNSGFGSGNGKPLKAIGTVTADIALDGDDDTRATVTGNNGTYRPVFDEGDELRVFELYNNGAWFCEEVNSTSVSKDSDKASTTITRTIYETDPDQDYLLFYPASALVDEENVIKGYGATPTVKLNVPTVQHPTNDAPDTKATILYAWAKNVEHATKGEGNLKSKLQTFKSLTAYGKMTLRGLDNNKTVEKVKVTILGYTQPKVGSTTSYITGTYYNYQFDKEYQNASSEYYDPQDATGANYVELVYTDENPLEVNNGQAVVWFSIMANKYLAGNESVGYASSFVVEVTYKNSDTVTKQFFNKKNSNGELALRFKNGAVTTLSVNMAQNEGSTTEPDYPTEFKKVTSVEDGKKYILAVSYGGQQYVLRNDGTYQTSSGSADESYAIRLTALTSAGLTLNGDKLTTTDASRYTFLMSTQDVASDSWSKYKFYSTTRTTAWIRLYNSSYFILSENTNQYEGLTVGDNGTTLFKSNDSGQTNNYSVYTDDGQTVKATSTKQPVISIYGVDTGTNSGPNMVEPLLEEKLEINPSTSSANQYHNSSPIGKLFDGRVDAYEDPDIYHSPWQSGDPGSNNLGQTNFPVELTFGLTKVSDVYRMHYYTRATTNDKAIGDPGVFDVHYQTADGVWHQAKDGTYGSANAYMYDFGKKRGTNQKDGGYYHEVDFSASPLKGATAVKLTFYTGNDNGTYQYISGAEVEFYGEEATPENKLSITAVANQEHNSDGTNSKASNLTDGYIPQTTSAEGGNSIFHTPWQNESWTANGQTYSGTVFPVEITFKLNTKSDVVRFDYYTQISGTSIYGVANGLPGKFDVLYRCDGDEEGVYRALNPNYNANKSNDELLATAQFDMGKQVNRPFTLRFPNVLRNVVEVKVVFYEGTQNDNSPGYIAGVEAELYGEAK